MLTQHRTDPRLGPRGLALLRSGCSAQETLDALVGLHPHAQWRQLAVLDAAGTTAAFSGTRAKPEMSEAPAQDVCAIGNILASARVPPAMLRAFQADPTDRWPNGCLMRWRKVWRPGASTMPVRSALPAGGGA